MDLTPRERVFAEAYVRLGDATAAYGEAYSVANMKRATQQRKAALVKSRPRVAAYIEELFQANRWQHTVSEDRVLRELQTLAYSDVSDVFWVEGNDVRMTDFAKLAPETRRAIASIKAKVLFTLDPEKDGREGELVQIEIKMHAKDAALRDLARHLGLFERDNSQRGESWAKELMEMVDGSSRGV